MSIHNFALAIIVTIATSTVAYAEDFGYCAQRVAELQRGKTAIAELHEVWFAPNRNWLKADYPAAMVVSHEFGIEAATTGPTEAFAQYESVWNASQTGWYIVAEPSAAGYDSEHDFFPFYLFSGNDTCVEIMADWWIEISHLPPEMAAMLE